jgi:hypothetical protein
MKLINQARWVVVVGIALLLSGCVLPKLYEWSPDGKWLTVLTGDDAGDLLIANPDGQVQAGRLQGVKVATWFPDSQHLLVARELQAKTWDSAAFLFSADQIKSIADVATRLGDFAKTYDWKAPKADTWDQFQAKFTASEQQAERNDEILNSQPAAVAMYFRDHSDDATKAKIPEARWNELAEFNQSYTVVQVCTFDPAQITVGPTLMTGLNGVADLRVSPTAANVMIVVAKGDKNDNQELWLAPADGSAQAVKFVDQAATFPDFSPDGKDIAFMRPAQTQQGLLTGLGSLTRMRIIAENGKLIPPSASVTASGATATATASSGPAALPNDADTTRPSKQLMEDLVGVAYSPTARLRWLNDGRIIFSGYEITLPAASNDISTHSELFSVTPGKQAVVSRLLPRQALEQVGDGAEYFEMSPDGTRVSIPDSSGKVDVVDLGSGAVDTVQDKPTPKPGKDQGDALQTIPVWRSNDQLTFIAPDGKGGTQVMLWSISKNSGKVLSGGWAAATQPATQPAAAH